jgi:hypothetical protein
MGKGCVLEISVYSDGQYSTDIPRRARSAVMAIPELGQAFKQHLLTLSDIRTTRGNWFTSGVAKRQFICREGE